jgi:predicted TIM-barrel fold metal-dependent hydrolase
MVDAHVHVWAFDPQRYPWQPTLAHVPVPDEPATAEMLIAEMDRAGVSHAVLVQPSVYGWNNAYMCDCLARWPSRFVGVCLVDPRSADAPEKLSHWVRERNCKGLRVNLIGEEEVGWLLAPERAPLWDAARALGISISLQMRPQHASVVEQLAAAWPAVIFIVDYLGAAAFHDGTGIAALDALGRLSNVWYKILSLGQDSKRPHPFADLWPLYEQAFKSFGTGRLVFGTDFPHIYKTSSYADGIGWLDALPFLDAAARRAIGDGNARALWRIDHQRSKASGGS